MLDYESGLGQRVIGLAIEVHRALGPGLLESAYEECLCLEIGLAGIDFARQVPLPITCNGKRLNCGYRLDVVVANEIEVKAIDRLLPIHEAQLLTCLRLSGHRVGFLKNFNALTLKEGLRRLVLSN
jgi:GxxExxY protein